MTYTTEELTEALQELTERAQHQTTYSTLLPSVIQMDQLSFSQEVEDYLRERQDYMEQTRTASFGSY